jgi:acetoin utilization deacetylase AcuC-like enzyme
MLSVYTDDHRLHHAKAEFIHGELVPSFEMPKRADYIIGRLREVGLGEVITPEAQQRRAIERIHSAAYLAFLEGAWTAWHAEYGDCDAFPNTWPTRGMSQRVPEKIGAQLGHYCFDSSTAIMSGTWRAALSAAEVALTAASRVAGGLNTAFALCRPPGHHAAWDYYGGYCFLNNAAIAAQSFLDRGAGRVAILDVDYHHGNGTQSIFYGREDVFFLSLHADPRWDYPYFLGYAEETGEGAGEGFNANYPMPWGTAWPVYGEALADAIARIRRYGPDAIVVSLGVDTYKEDPISRFKLEMADYPRIGAMIAALGRPTLFVMEGGYAVEEIGINTVNLLQGFEGRS